MSGTTVAHVAAGVLAIGAGVGALVALKGGRAHRWFGQVFSASMVFVAMLGGALAVSAGPAVIGTPPQASVSVALLTTYLVVTAWLTVRRRSAGSSNALAGWAALGCAAAVAAALGVFGTLAAARGERPAAVAPYFVFAAFAAFGAVLDWRVVRYGKPTGAARVRRHLWRMCFAMFFATSFFFLGQQKVMPGWLRGSPVLTMLAFAPLVVMAAWLVRIWASRVHLAGRTGMSRVLAGLLAFRMTRQGACGK